MYAGNEFGRAALTSDSGKAKRQIGIKESIARRLDVFRAAMAPYVDDIASGKISLWHAGALAGLPRGSSLYSNYHRAFGQLISNQTDHAAGE